MSALWRALPLTASVLLPLGCGPLCDPGHRCAVAAGQAGPAAITVCDGSDFRACGDGNRGATITCGTMERRAICTPSGWTFENTGVPPPNQ
jgi:hypothetical protein